MEKTPVSVCWFRRDLRLTDHAALFHALNGKYPVLPVFVFDRLILEKLPDRKDKRVQFIFSTLQSLDRELAEKGSAFYIVHDTPLDAFRKICDRFNVREVYANGDYEPYALERDAAIRQMLAVRDIAFHSFKDQVIFGASDVVKDDGTPYTVYTPYCKKWKSKLKEEGIPAYPSGEYLSHLFQWSPDPFPTLQGIGFEERGETWPALNLSEKRISHYHLTRNNPSIEGTSFAGMYLRFGTVSIRQLVQLSLADGDQWLNELIWREFFMMILCHFPYVVDHNFKRKYDALKWRNNEEEFKKWCEGKTGYPIVDAGMRQLNETGWMHNRVRMITASFLCKDLLIDWRWGEAYFAGKLLDYELASNNGNWQWAAGTGCDAAPYFRIFNPSEQIRKFDPKLEYIKRWIPAFRPAYLPEMVNHDFARKRALAAYQEALQE